MSITTERQTSADARTIARANTAPRSTVRQGPPQRRAADCQRRTADRQRRTGHPAAPQSLRRTPGGRIPGGRIPSGHILSDRCTEASHAEDRMSWTAAVAGVVATALVVVGLIAVANLRAGSLDTAPVPGTAIVQQGETLSDVAARVAPNTAVQQVVDRMIELNDMGGASVLPGQQLLTPSFASK